MGTLRELVRLSTSGSLSGGMKKVARYAKEKGYARIAYSIGRGINQRREVVGADPLPDRLLELLHSLREKDDVEDYISASQNEEAPTSRFDLELA